MLKALGSLILIFICGSAFADIEVGSTMYTKQGFFAEKGKSYSTNYRAGLCIPRGSEVVVTKIKSKYAELLVNHFNIGKVKLINPRKHSNMDTESYLNRMLSKTKPGFAKFSKSKREAIKGCRANVGMTKDEVVAAIGYPPAHVTPSTEMNQWKYWKKRFNTEMYYFDSKGKLINIED